MNFESYKELAEFLDIDSISQVSWGHAVNSQTDLAKYKEDNTVQIIEGDISLSEEGTVIMAHPPVKESDLTFSDWVNTVSNSGKVLKLDFKVEEGIEESLNLLATINLKSPVLINADILKGPGGIDSVIDAQRFIGLCKEQYPDGILSIGWKTSVVEGEKYSDANIDQMLELIDSFGGLVTFPVRAYYMKKSLDQLKRLINNEKYSLSIWNNELVEENFEHWVKDNFDPNKYFIDLIDNQRLRELGHL